MVFSYKRKQNFSFIYKTKLLFSPEIPLSVYENSPTLHPSRSHIYYSPRHANRWSGQPHHLIDEKGNSFFSLHRQQMAPKDICSSNSFSLIPLGAQFNCSNPRCVKDQWFTVIVCGFLRFGRFSILNAWFVFLFYLNFSIFTLPKIGHISRGIVRQLWVLIEIKWKKKKQWMIFESDKNSFYLPKRQNGPPNN